MDIDPNGWAAIVGAFEPIVVSLLKRPEWPTWAKVGTACVVSLAVGVGSILVAGSVDLANLHDHPGAILGAAAAAFTASTLVYRLWFENTILNDRLTEFPST